MIREKQNGFSLFVLFLCKPIKFSACSSLAAAVFVLSSVSAVFTEDFPVSPVEKPVESVENCPRHEPEKTTSFFVYVNLRSVALPFLFVTGCNFPFLFLEKYVTLIS